MGIGRVPSNITRGCVFIACPNKPVFISATDIHMLMPIFRKTECGDYVDAMGEYNLCMNEEQTHYKFVSCLEQCETFMYRFIPGNWFAKRKGFQKP
jgi:hypothetical protein